jgi:hypothetical protein
MKHGRIFVKICEIQVQRFRTVRMYGLAMTKRSSFEVNGFATRSSKKSQNGSELESKELTVPDIPRPIDAKESSDPIEAKQQTIAVQQSLSAGNESKNPSQTLALQTTKTKPKRKRASDAVPHDENQKDNVAVKRSRLS